MDRPDMRARAGVPVRAPLSEPPDPRFDREWEDWMSEAPTAPMFLPRFDSEPEPEPFRDDDVFMRMVDRTGRRKRAVPHWVLPLAGSVAAAVILGLAFFQFRGGPPPQSVASSSPAEVVIVPASVSGTPVAQCPAERVGDRIQGNGAGGADSGPSAIFAFQYAYYVSRSAAQARAVVAPDASVAAAPAIQRGIDSIPAGTTYCVSMTPGDVAGQYVVVVTEYRPGTAALVYHPQAVSTGRVGGKTLITGIAPAR